MKKLMAVILTASMLCACGGCGGGSGEIDPSRYETQEKFITIADVPPNPLADLSDYTALGFSGYILTEDFVPLTENGAVSARYRAAIEAAAAAGLDVYIRNQYNDPQYFQNSDTSVRDHYVDGTTYTIPERNLTDEFSAYDAVKGFYMADEPDFDDLDDYAGLIEWYNTYYADTYFHMNLYPSYASGDHFSSNSYQAYVQRYIDLIAANVKGHKSICLDNYPFYKPGIIRPSFLSDLLIVARRTREYNAKAAEADRANFGLCIQAFRDSGLLDITCWQEISFQLCVGMAMGARVYEYFCYNSANSFGLSGIVDNNGAKRIYDHVKEANDRYLGFEKVLCAFDWQGITTLTAQSPADVENEDAFLTVGELLLSDTGRLNAAASTSRLDTLIGCFRQGRQDGYMVVNYTLPSGSRTNTVTLKFNNAARAIIYEATENGVQSRVTDLVEGSLRLSLGAGEGAFVIPV